MNDSYFIDNNAIAKNIQSLQDFMIKENIDAFIVTSFDSYLNEYSPIENNHRYFITGFTGSTSEAVVLQTGQVRLYVDGRYHERALREVCSSLVTVILAKNIQQQMLDDLRFNNFCTVGFEADRIPLSYVNTINNNHKTKAYLKQDMDQLIDFPVAAKAAKVNFITKEHRGLDTREKLIKVIANKQQGYFITAIDSLAWITNCRGYHLPYHSSFLGCALVVHNQVYVFIEPEITIAAEVKNRSDTTFISMQQGRLAQHLQQLQEQYQLTELYYDPDMISYARYTLLIECFNTDTHTVTVAKQGGLACFHSVKDDGEIAEIKSSFARADQAIYSSICWVKQKVADGESISEVDLYHETTNKYQENGALAQSFSTIAAVGANSSMVHYGAADHKLIINRDHMILLDSGGYFAGGFATDTTRTFMAGNKEPNSQYKHMYTLVLKGLLRAQNAIFPDGTLGASIDILAREPLYRAGKDFDHGTGHGIGIHVHEGGVRLSKVSTMPMKKDQVVSIEPGLYVPGFAGVRLENIAHVVAHPQFTGFLTFEVLVYIGFDPLLIEHKLLTYEEQQWLEQYEQICSQRGTSFR